MMLNQRFTPLQDTCRPDLAASCQSASGDRPFGNASQQADFLAQTSHDIRLPVSNVVGMAELLQRTELSEKQREYVDLLKVSADAALSLVNRLLDLKRLEAGGLMLEERPFDLCDCLEQTLRLLQPAADAKGMQLRCHLPANLPHQVIGDPLRLRQVLMNLLDNAVKFTRCGTVTLTVRLIASNSSHARLHFAVIDSGIGIPPDRQQQIFSPYVQAHESTTRCYGGSGLGLSIVAGIVEKMGGMIVLESEPGVGSVFEFGLDFDLPPSWQAEVSAPTVLRILVADDDPVSRELAICVLQNAGHQVTCVSDGRQAIAAVEENKFDLLLIDLQMPGMNGLAATRIIRHHEKLSGKPLLIMALSAGLAETRTCLQAGMDDCLIKPLSADAVQRAVARSRVPVIDRASLLERANGDHRLLAEVASLFAARSQTLLVDGRMALETDDSAKLGQVMHTLTGMFKTLSAEAARLAAEEFKHYWVEPGAGAVPAFYRLECEVDRLGFALGGFIREVH